MDLSSFVHLLLDGRVGTFHLVAIMNNAAMNTWVQSSLCGRLFSFFFGCIPRCGIDGSGCHSVFIFFEEPPDVFPSNPACFPVTVSCSQNKGVRHIRSQFYELNIPSANNNTLQGACLHKKELKLFSFDHPLLGHLKVIAMPMRMESFANSS